MGQKSAWWQDARGCAGRMGWGSESRFFKITMLARDTAVFLVIINFKAPWKGGSGNTII